MQNLIPLIVAGLFVYLIFFRRGGMGSCCGGHGGNESVRHPEMGSRKSIHDRSENVIDLHEDEYSILPSNDDKIPRNKSG